MKDLCDGKAEKLTQDIASDEDNYTKIDSS